MEITAISKSVVLLDISLARTSDVDYNNNLLKSGTIVAEEVSVLLDELGASYLATQTSKYLLPIFLTF